MSSFSRSDIKKFFSEVMYESIDEKKSKLLREGEVDRRELEVAHDPKAMADMYGDRQQAEAGVSGLEYKLANVISQAYYGHELNAGKQAQAGASWPQEVDRATADLEDALIDGGALDDVLKFIDAVSQKLHNGEYHSKNSGMRAGPNSSGPMWDD